MPRNASGVMSLAGQFAVPNNVPASSTINSYIDDILSEITNSLDRDGKASMRAHLKMGGYKLTGLGDGTAATDGVSVQQLQSGKVAWADGGGAADAITASYSPAIAALVDGMRLRVRATAANATTTPTFSPNGLTARTIKKLNNQALAVGDIAGDEHDLDLTYVAAGTYWNLNNPKFASVSGSASVTSLSVSGTVALTGDITPAQITSDQTDYAPTDHATATVFRISSDAYRTINSLAGGADGREVELHNIGASTIALLEDDGATGTAANRFKTSAGFGAEIFAGASAILRYDVTASRWRVLSPSIASAGPSTMEAASSTSSFVSPGNMHRHPGHPKFWGYVTVAAGTPTLQTSYNITSITDTATGRLTVTIATDFSSANWSPFVTVQRPGTLAELHIPTIRNATIAAGTVQFENLSLNGGGSQVLADPESWSVSGLGDQ